MAPESLAPRDFRPKNWRNEWPPLVTIYGAGIAGLTAAQELAERGFTVIVYEPEEDVRAERDTCQVGGMARTHWVRIETSDRARLPERAGLLSPITPFREKIGFTRDRATIDDPGPELDAEARKLADHSKAALDAVAEKLAAHPEITRFYIDGIREPDEREGIDHERAQAVYESLIQRGISKERLRVRYLGAALSDVRGLIPEAHRIVQFNKSGRELPGEHGYRFFPSFYRHVFDTMRRIPLLQAKRASDLAFASSVEFFERYNFVATDTDQGRVYEATGRTVHDNIIALQKHEVDRADGLAPEPLPRQPSGSFKDIARMLRALFGDLRFSPRDVGLFQVKLFKYATSCEPRRREYEKLTWLEFLEIERYSPEFKQAMEQWPQALLAMRASRCDARTYGNMVLQLLLDQVRPTFTDGTLNGPTSEAWLDPWRTYLEHVHSVVFLRGKLTCLKLMDPGLTADVSPRDRPRLGYIVLAVPIEQLPEVITDQLIEALDQWNAERPERSGKLNTLRVARDFARRAMQPDLGAGPRERRALADFSGIQYFFNGDIHFVDGHTYFPDSEWGLSAIPQAHFRKDPMSWRTKFRGVLSVDIGQWHAPGNQGMGKTAWDSTPNEIAEEVLRQIRAGIEGGSRRVPEPIGYHIDDSMVFTKEGGVRANLSRFLINPPGTWDIRPGEPGDYDLMFDSLVLAGTYNKTYTRLTTMEAANESARHAVNAILRQLPEEQKKFIGNECQVWPLEEREVDDLDVFKEIDRGLWDRGMPHQVDISKLDRLPDNLLPKEPWPPRAT